ncbi:hypothetical protein ABW20_dc0100460 [Dactylellina cionopaga]|nr:hypothetical protein ABW20_dc0100460 [Dactylellina cionopaga]
MDIFNGFGNGANNGHSSKKLHADDSQYLTKAQALNLITNTINGSSGQGLQKSVRVLVRWALTDPNTDDTGPPSAYRVTKFKGDENYIETIEIVSDRLSFNRAPGKTLRSIQFHDEPGTTQVIIDNDESVKYVMDMLREGANMRMTVYAIEDDLHGQQDGKRKLVDAATSSTFDPSATPMYTRHRRFEDGESKNNSGFRDPEGNDRNRRQDNRRTLSIYEDEGKSSHTPRGCGRERRRSPERRHVYDRSASPRYREKPVSYRERDYDRENDPKISRSNKQTTTIKDERDRDHARFEYSDSYDSPRSIRAASNVDEDWNVETPGYNYSHQDASGYNNEEGDDDIEDGEVLSINQGEASQAPLDKVPSKVTEENRGRQTNYGKAANHDNGRRDVKPTRLAPKHPPGDDGNRPHGPGYRFCNVLFSEAGQEKWTKFSADHLRLRLCPAEKFQSGYSSILDELFERKPFADPNSRYVDREGGLVMMLYMRIAPRPADTSVYDANGDVGVLINLKALVKGSFRWTWKGEILSLRFRTDPAFAMIKRSTDSQVAQEVGGPAKNGTSHIAINIDNVPAARARQPNFRAIKALADSFDQKEKSFDVIFQVSRAQLPQDAYELMANLEGGLFEPTGPFDPKPVQTYR